MANFRVFKDSDDDEVLVNIYNITQIYQTYADEKYSECKMWFIDDKLSCLVVKGTLNEVHSIISGKGEV